MEDSRLGALRTVSSRPEGVRATVGEQVGRWRHNPLGLTEQDVEHNSDDPEMEAGVGRHPRIGIGLPMSNIFATYVALACFYHLLISPIGTLEGRSKWYL